MPQLCEISRCEYQSLTVCRCCKQHLCREHFVVHDHSIRLKLNHLTDEIDQIVHRLSIFDIDVILGDVLKKLNEWRLQSYQVIDQFYQEKYREVCRFINDTFNNEERKAEELQSKIIQTVNVQRTVNTDLQTLSSSIELLKREIHDLEHMSIELHTIPLVLKENQISMEVSVSSPADLSNLSTIHQRIARLPLSSDVITSNDQYLLIHQNSNLVLLNKSFVAVRQKRWPYDWIRDMCWSSTLNCFFVVTMNKIYSVQEDTLTIQLIKSIEGRFWQSCTCSERSLYLSKENWTTSIEEYSLFPTIKFVKLWKTNSLLGYQQRIDSMRYSNGSLALAINDRMKKEMSLELRSITTFECLWSCPLNIVYSERKLQCCLFDQSHWLIADWGTQSFLQVNNDGHIEKNVHYDFEVHHVTLWGSNTLITTTNTSFNIHHL